MGESRVQFLEQSLSTLGYEDTLRALDWMVAEMCAEKGFARHDGTHYYYHLVDTTQDLLSHGIRDQDILTACMLHDSIEDVEGITYRMIDDKFNRRVANIVLLLTKRPGVDYKQSAHTLIYLRSIYEDVGAALIKTADRKHNFGTLRDASPEKKLRQALQTEELFIPFFKACRKKYPRYAGYFFSAKTAIEPHLWEIKAHAETVRSLKEEIANLQDEVVFCHEHM